MINLKQQNLSPEGQEKVETFGKYFDTISDIRDKIFSGLGYESTDQFMFNKAYFTQGQEITRDFIEEKVNKAEEKINEIQNIREKVKTDISLNFTQRKLIEKSISGSILNLKYHQNAIYIEAEKGGFDLPKEEREIHNKEKKKIEQQLYGDSILSMEFRKEKVCEKLHTQFQKNQQKLSEEERNFWEKNITPELRERKNEKEERVENKKEIFINEKNIFPLVSLALQIEGFEKDDLLYAETSDTTNEIHLENNIFQIPTTRTAKQINTYFKEKGLESRLRIVKRKQGMNGVSISSKRGEFKNNTIYIAPAENEKYAIEKILHTIFDHEISTHVNTNIGNIKNLNIKDGDRAEIEEGVATLNERYSQGKKIDEYYEAGIGDIGQFLGEIFDEKELKKALAICKKIGINMGNIDDRTRRIKMGVPLGEKGTRRKDMIYGSGKDMIKELEELTKTVEGREMLNKYAKTFYSTKLGPDSIKNIDEVLEGIIDLEHLEPNFPIFAGKIIYRKLFKGKLNKEAMLANDLRSVIKTNKEVSYKQRRLLREIIQIIEQDPEYQKSRYTTEE